MKKNGLRKGSGESASLSGRFFRTASVLLLLSLAATPFIRTFYARYRQSGTLDEPARVARMAQAELCEHRAVLDGGRYTLDMSTVVHGNTYDAVLPGTDIPKDPYVDLDGSNEVACDLYIEIFTNAPDEVSYTVGTSFAPTSEVSPQHGGTVYKYSQPIPPNTQQTVGYILRGNTLTVSDTFRDKTNPGKNAAPFRFDVYAYLLQID